ncbi:Sorbitol dehydrogenase [Komagataella phaffii CBS 7435]|uniref:Enoyl reductase (ER) domain-containing protein n=2 Tax=Komagataella phaffii TaxID=460519 RepID=C4QWM9_KOMPG|nr:uncharacterized protein PAS_chr1-1_0490 [Komagataella phaffii GS115]AOA60779.1 GQ67_02862T0 [Komagataella phaffii]CAH2446388.1 Sorbitol dehydrogenase [Komagataella phaffii CBS 7435]AOA66395.1 GQ68_02385T0 [Komagataella phaffii GS115]CAY67652.1 hypothetical protein PAS_chr1-1_0490 [Komagataella phaffii GS115]CCA36746.1 Sorbitol dehydrogenase [Komagataella phaffii CBS 7435]
MSDNPSVILKRINEIVIEDRPIPAIEDPHYVKIAIKKTGICGSDVHFYTDGCCGSFKLESPMVLGHESAGIVVEVGSEVKSLRVGDKVACEPGIPSRYSNAYKSGHYNLCPEMAFAATPPIDGTLCRYFLLPEDFCVKLPEHVSLEEGALVEPLSVAVHAARLAKITFGDSVVVFGAGPVGLLVAATARAYGATNVLIVDIFDDKLTLAKDTLQVATHSFNSKNGMDNLLESFEGKHPNVSIDCTGVESCIAAGINALAPRGVHVQVGMGKSEYNNFPLGLICEKECIVKGVFRYCYNDYNLAVELIASGKVEVKGLVTHRFKFTEAVDAYDTVRQGKAIKAIIDGPE